MAPSSRRYWILGLIGLLVIGLGLAALNWRSLANNLGQAWETQAEKTEISLFKLGEVASIQARLRERFGARPEVQYEDEAGVRVLSISFADAPNLNGKDAKTQARAVGVAAVQATKKSNQIDEVVVILEKSEFRFTVGELLSTSARTHRISSLLVKKNHLPSAETNGQSSCPSLLMPSPIGSPSLQLPSWFLTLK